MARDIDNGENVIDSRNVIERIEAIQEELNDAQYAPDEEEDLRDELKALMSLQEEAEGYAEDWKDGATLIRDSYFKEYAIELAQDIDAIIREATWPNDCIDWDRAARELKMDYRSVDFAGVTYWVR